MYVPMYIHTFQVKKSTPTTREAQHMCVFRPAVDYQGRGLTMSLNAFDAVNTGDVVALISSSSPVRGLRPMRPFRARPSKVPKPCRLIFFPSAADQQRNVCGGHAGVGVKCCFFQVTRQAVL